jgi:hypothetical protein
MDGRVAVCYDCADGTRRIGTPGMMTFIGTLFIMYWLPTIIAIVRQAHSALGVFLVNFLFGWTVLGWILALIWSLAADNRVHEVVVHVDRPSPR